MKTNKLVLMLLVIIGAICSCTKEEYAPKVSSSLELIVDFNNYNFGSSFAYSGYYSINGVKHNFSETVNWDSQLYEAQSSTIIPITAQSGDYIELSATVTSGSVFNTSNVTIRTVSGPGLIYSDSDGEIISGSTATVNGYVRYPGDN